MRFCASPPFAMPGFRGERTRFFAALFLLLASLATPTLHAQDAPPPPEPDGSAPYVLHLYARLVELPTLIFIRDEKRPLLDAREINIKLTSTTLKATLNFHPVSVRLQNNDPLSIAILLDVSGDQSKLLAAVQRNFPAWVTQSLLPQDHVSIFALDCNLIQTSIDVPASNPSLLQSGLDLALASPLSHSSTGKPSCSNSIRLRGSISFVMGKLAKLPGRRILLVVSSGSEGKTSISWHQLGTIAGDDSVTVFGLSTHGPWEFGAMREIYTFTQQTGGLLFSPAPANVPAAMDQFIRLLRGRYILQFPMPHDISPVTYRVVVTVPKFDAIILPSGIGVPLPNPSVDHPSTDVPSEAPPPEANPQPQPVAPPSISPNQ